MSLVLYLWFFHQTTPSGPTRLAKKLYWFFLWSLAEIFNYFITSCWTHLVPNLSETESCQILNLPDTEPIRYLIYQTPKLSDIGPYIRYQTYNTESIRYQTYQIPNLSDTDLLEPLLELPVTKQVHPSPSPLQAHNNRQQLPACHPDPLALSKLTINANFSQHGTPPVLCGEIWDEKGPLRSALLLPGNTLTARCIYSV